MSSKSPKSTPQTRKSLKDKEKIPTPTNTQDTQPDEDIVKNTNK